MQEYKNLDQINLEIKRYFQLKDDYWKGKVKLIELSSQAVVIKKLIFAEKDVITSHYLINKFKFGTFKQITDEARIAKEETDFYFVFAKDDPLHKYVIQHFWSDILFQNEVNYRNYDKQHHLNHQDLAQDVATMQKLTLEASETEGFVK